MFDDQSFSTEAFSTESWLFAALAGVRREIVRLYSAIARALTLASRV